MEINEFIEWLYNKEAIRVEDLDKDMYLYIDSNYQNIKPLIRINRVGKRVLISLSSQVRREFKNKKEM